MLFAAPPQAQTLPPGSPDTQFREFPMLPESPPLEQDRYIDIDALVNETETGRFMLGVGVNSDAGLTGSIVVDEQNFDISRWPRNFQEILDGSAFRGRGQRFRVEALPGNQVQRYTVSFQEPYLFDTPISFGVSGYFFNRLYTDWDEERIGGRPSLGYQFTPDLSGTISVRAEQVTIYNPVTPTPPEIQRTVGPNSLYSFGAKLAHDTRDSAFLATEGHLIEFGFEQAIGTYQFPKATVDARQYFLLRQRPDGSGRHTLSLSGRFGVSGSDTPVFENFFAGGFSSIRGFRFRGASPQTDGAIVGGRLELIGSAEYMFPITADDMLRGVVFCDFGTVEKNIEITGDDFRVAPGAGLRVTVPALGPAPIALDLAFPVAHAKGDEIQNFSFFVGYMR
jgi:outer membrane protein insertion porin family